MRIHHIVIAILRQAQEIVMVQQRSPHNQRPFWVLPGGLVEAGELLTEALIREVQEEAGVQVTEIGALVALSQIDRPAHSAQALVFMFEIGRWYGTLHCQDPDAEVHGVELVPSAEAIRRLQLNGGWSGIQEPLLAYLRGEAQAGTIWFYREQANRQRWLSTLPPAHR